MKTFLCITRPGFRPVNRTGSLASVVREFRKIGEHYPAPYFTIKRLGYNAKGPYVTLHTYTFSR